MDDVARAFLDRSRYYLRGEYLPKIERCVALLSADDLWWRPNDASNSVGNLLLHLAGNVRQWIVHGVGGAPDVRDRQQEFEAGGPVPAEALLAGLRAALDDVDAVLAGLDAATLMAQRTIQGRDLSVLVAVYHVVEHFAAHTGQILYVTKLRTGRDLAFYGRSPTAAAQWKGGYILERFGPDRSGLT